MSCPRLAPSTFSQTGSSRLVKQPQAISLLDPMWRPALRLPSKKLRPCRQQLSTLRPTWAPQERLCGCQLASGTVAEGGPMTGSHIGGLPALGNGRPGSGRRLLASSPRWAEEYSARWLHGKPTSGAMQADHTTPAMNVSPEQFALMSTLSSLGPESQLPEAFHLPETINQELVGAMHRALLNFTNACNAGKTLQLQLHRTQWAEAEPAQRDIRLATSSQAVAEELNSALDEQIQRDVLERAGLPEASRRRQRPTVLRPAPAEPEPARDRPEFDQWGREVDAVLPFAGHQAEAEEEEETEERKEEVRQEEELVSKSEAIRQRHAQFYERIERQRAREMEAHQRAAEEYRELLNEMNKKRLGPNLPIGRALMLAWFKPLRDAIKAEQDSIKNGSSRLDSEYVRYAARILPLDPDVLAVIASHRIVELLLEEHGRHGLEDTSGRTQAFFPRSKQGYLSFVKMVTAATSVGRAVEMEVKVSNALAKIREKVEKAKAARPTKVKKASKGKKGASAEPAEMSQVEPAEPVQVSADRASDAEMPWIPGMKKGKPPTKEEARALFERDKVRAGIWAQEEEGWDEATVVQVGTLLIELLIKAAKVPDGLLSRGSKRKRGSGAKEEGASSGSESESEAIPRAPTYENLQQVLDATTEERASWKPAVIHDHVYLKEPGDDDFCRRDKRYGAVCCSEEVKAMIDNAANGFIPTMPYMPMLVKPRRWRSHNSGGHLMLPCSIMRTHGAKEQRKALKRAGDSMNKVYQALNVLGDTPWRINQRVADVMGKLWEQGGNVAGLVNRADEPVPPSLTKAEAQKLRAENPEAWRNFIKVKKKAEKINAERHSLRADMKLKLDVVQDFRKEERFYYPHNLDFRGRAYPMHPHLNHLGADPSRGVLEFAEGRPLGPRGLYWLKVHLANVVGGGVDKLSYEDRAAYADQNMENIRDSAWRSMEGEQWWTKAEDPFQCLATCMNIVDAIDSGDPENFISHLPVHQDGSCNGLQHYAALGRDLAGAQQVNMTRTAKPADVYTGISEIVKKIVAKDAESNDERKAQYARYLVGHVDRKLVKQTVMTSVYGVTFIGARGQIHNRIKEKGIIAEDDIAYKTACYAAKTTLEALSEMFFSARHIMAWLAECARLIAKENNTVEWVTPMGLPVVQPYRKASVKQIRTTLQCISLSDPNNEKVSASRQRSAFPPNFVHSLDSSHMMRTALACKARGLHFAGVHDSFWTHAGNVDEMNEILRREFVALHSQPILEDLLGSFRERHPHINFPEVPARGELDLNAVLDAPYFFS